MSLNSATHSLNTSVEKKRKKKKKIDDDLLPSQDLYNFPTIGQLSKFGKSPIKDRLNLNLSDDGSDRIPVVKPTLGGFGGRINVKKELE